MKVLALFAAVFIPLTFIVGVYGMNFKHMPELGWSWAYPALWLIMLGLGGDVLLFPPKEVAVARPGRIRHLVSGSPMLLPAAPNLAWILWPR